MKQSLENYMYQAVTNDERVKFPGLVKAERTNRLSKFEKEKKRRQKHTSLILTGWTPGQGAQHGGGRHDLSSAWSRPAVPKTRIAHDYEHAIQSIGGATTPVS